MKRILLGLMTMLLFATACSGSSASDQLTVDSARADTTPRQGANDLIVELGSEQAAVDALIIAMDRGYSGSQILDSVASNTLRSNGIIEGQTPATEPLDLVVHDTDGQGEGAIERQTVSQGEVVLASFFQIEQTPIEQLRANATRNLGVGEPALDFILRLLQAGFEPPDVIEMLILGIDGVADYPLDRDGPLLCATVIDEIYCPFGERFPVPSNSEAATTTADDEAQPIPADGSEAPSGPVTFTGSASQGAIENDSSDDLRSVDFTATIDGSTVVMQATMIVHAWHRGGYEEQFVDQNCGATYRHVLRFEGPSGNPTELRAVVEASEILEVQGVLCDDDDAERDLLTAGESAGRFRGQLNGLGIDGTIDLVSLPLDITAS